MQSHVFKTFKCILYEPAHENDEISVKEGSALFKQYILTATHVRKV